MIYYIDLFAPPKMLHEEVLSLPSWILCFNLPARRVSNLSLQVGVHTLEGRSSALAAHLKNARV